MAANQSRPATPGASAWGDAARALLRAARAVAAPDGPQALPVLARSLGDVLQADAVLVAVHAGAGSTLRTLSAVLDGRMLDDFEFELAGSSLASGDAAAFRHAVLGVEGVFESASALDTPRGTTASHTVNRQKSLSINTLPLCPQRLLATFFAALAHFSPDTPTSGLSAVLNKSDRWAARRLFFER